MYQRNEMHYCFHSCLPYTCRIPSHNEFLKSIDTDSSYKDTFHSDTESHLRGMHRTLTSPQSKGTLQMRAHTYTQSKTKNCLPDPKLVLLYVQQPGQVRCHHNVLPYIFRKIHTYLDNNISAG